MKVSTDIPQGWIKEYVDQLLEIASRFDDGPMRAATLLRVDHALDLMQAWRESELRKKEPA